MSISTRYDEVLASAQRLPLGDQLRLASALTSAAAGMVVRSPVVGVAMEDGWTRWNHVRTDLSSRPQGVISMSDQLERDRAERQAMLEGHDVHP